MLGRERALMALNHEEPDRVPIDLGSTEVTGICRDAYADLLARMGLSGQEVRVVNMLLQLAGVDEEILQALEVDFRSITTNPPAGFRPEVRDEGDYETYHDQWGAKLSRPKIGGHYFDYVECPIKESTLEALGRHSWPDPDDPSRYEGLRERARALREGTSYALVGSCGLGGDILARPQWIRGYADSMLDLAANPDFVEAFLERLTEIAVRAWEHFLGEVGEYLDVAAFGDDLGIQDGPMISPAMYRRFVKPRHARIIETIRAGTKAKVFMHSCGAVSEFIPDMIEIGVDILNPVQPDAMDPARLKDQYGDRLAFFGTVGTPRMWSWGTPEDIRAEVRERIETVGAGGGLIISPAYDLEPEESIPWENVVAFFDAVEEFGVYG